MTDSSMTYDYDIGGLDALYHSDPLGSASWKKERFGKPFASERADEARSGILNNTNNTVHNAPQGTTNVSGSPAKNATRKPATATSGQDIWITS